MCVCVCARVAGINGEFEKERAGHSVSEKAREFGVGGQVCERERESLWRRVYRGVLTLIERGFKTRVSN